MDPATLSGLFTLGSAIFGGLLGGGGQEITPEQRRLFGAQERALNTENALQQLLLARRRSQDPLFRALSQAAFMRLPIFAKQGIEFPDFSQPTQQDSAIPQMPRERGDREPLGRAIPRY